MDEVVRCADSPRDNGGQEGKGKHELSVPGKELVAPTSCGHVRGSPSQSDHTLLETFADQTAIAIENTGLFKEVQARNRDLTALGEVGRSMSSTLDLKIVLKTIVDRAVDLSGTDAGSIFYFREEVGRFELGETSGLSHKVPQA